jgi:ketosteroid isomerase-like protein
MADWRADLCREAYAAFQRLDSEAAVAVYDPDCVWDVGAASAALGQQTYRGHDGLRQLMREVREVFPDWHPVVEELRLRDDGALLVRARVEATSRDSGMPLEIPLLGQVIEFRGRAIHRVTQAEFPPPGWEEAAGLAAGPPSD